MLWTLRGKKKVIVKCVWNKEFKGFKDDCEYRVKVDYFQVCIYIIRWT